METGTFLSATVRLAPIEHTIAKLAHPYLPKESIVVLKFRAQGDGYWNSNHFIAQLENAIKIAKFKYPASDNDLFFLFDQTSGHCAYVENAFIAH